MLLESITGGYKRTHGGFMKLTELNDEGIEVLRKLLLFPLPSLDRIIIKESFSEHVEGYHTSFLPFNVELHNALYSLGIMHYRLISDPNYLTPLGRAEIILKLADKE